MDQKMRSKAAIFYAGSDYDHPPHQELHFLESCSLCQKPLGLNSDIFMYRGNAPFCSEECREDQIEIDEDKRRVRRRKTSSSSKRRSSFRESSDQKTDKSSSIQTKDVRTDPVFVA